MSENNISDIINDGGEITLVDIAALSIATTLFISQGDEEMLKAIGSMADVIKESFRSDNEDKETNDQQEEPRD
jgi:hypothetical protein